jgi:hypothetical protein
MILILCIKMYIMYIKNKDSYSTEKFIILADDLKCWSPSDDGHHWAKRVKA